MSATTKQSTAFETIVELVAPIIERQPNYSDKSWYFHGWAAVFRDEPPDASETLVLITPGLPGDLVINLSQNNPVTQLDAIYANFALFPESGVLERDHWDGADGLAKSVANQIHAAIDNAYDRNQAPDNGMLRVLNDSYDHGYRCGYWKAVEHPDPEDYQDAIAYLEGLESAGWLGDPDIAAHNMGKIDAIRNSGNNLPWPESIELEWCARYETAVSCLISHTATPAEIRSFFGCAGEAAFNAYTRRGIRTLLNVQFADLWPAAVTTS